MRIPAGWIQGETTFEVLVRAWDVADPTKRIALSELRVDSRSLSNVAIGRAAQWSRQNKSYRVVSEEEVSISGREFLRVDYAYVVDRAGQLPLVVRGADFYAPRDADRVVLATFEAKGDEFDAFASRFAELMPTWEE